MRILVTIFFMILFMTCIGCDKSSVEEITEADAKQIIIDERSRECCGEAEIISVVSKSDKYVIRWEIESIYEKGTDSVNKKTGELKSIELNRGACQIK